MDIESKEGLLDLYPDLNKMAITGIGADIEDISRFKKLPFNKNKTFYMNIFTENEIEYCLKKADPYQHFAVRFCAKEALIKAMNQQVKDYKSIEVVFNKNKPSIKYSGAKVWLSLTHEKDKAAAFVVVENE